MKLRNRYVSFQTKIVVTIIMFLIPMFVLISWQFIQTGNVLSDKNREELVYAAKDVSDSINETVNNIYGVSDAFAKDSALDSYIERQYGLENKMQKQKDTMYILNRIFEGYDLLKQNEKMAALYTYKGELFNFLDPNCDETQAKAQLNAMGISNGDRLAKFCWYPLQDNFLRTDKTGDVRKDKVIIGSRRVFSNFSGVYKSIHIFALREEYIHALYANVERQFEANVYIMDENGGLLSSSDENAVREGRVSQELIDRVMKRDSDIFYSDDNERIMCIVKSDVSKWLTVVDAPKSAIGKTVNTLYQNIFLVIVISLILCTCMLIYFYRTLMEPVSRLNESMKCVYNGKLDAYVEVKSNNEMGRMIMYYNSMLNGINRNVKERLEMQKRRKDLEMEVLMSQINPHFLYNTLETIVWKSGEAGHPEIGRIAASLGRMYRLSVNNGDLIVPMKRELEHLTAYIRIQSVRYQDQFEFIMDESINDVKDFYCLKIILQPVVENAFLHGMDGLERKMYIRLKARVYDDRIEIVVTDTGKGMTKERLKQVRASVRSGTKAPENNTLKRHKSTGIGMNNVDERLKNYFGNDFGIDIYSKCGFGTMIVLRIPKLITPPGKRG